MTTKLGKGNGRTPGARSVAKTIRPRRICTNLHILTQRVASLLQFCLVCRVCRRSLLARSWATAWMATAQEEWCLRQRMTLRIQEKRTILKGTWIIGLGRRTTRRIYPQSIKRWPTSALTMTWTQRATMQRRSIHLLLHRKSMYRHQVSIYGSLWWHDSYIQCNSSTAAPL